MKGNVHWESWEEIGFHLEKASHLLVNRNEKEGSLVQRAIGSIWGKLDLTSIQRERERERTIWAVYNSFNSEKDKASHIASLLNIAMCLSVRLNRKNSKRVALYNRQLHYVLFNSNGTYFGYFTLTLCFIPLDLQGKGRTCKYTWRHIYNFMSEYVSGSISECGILSSPRLLPRIFGGRSLNVGKWNGRRERFRLITELFPHFHPTWFN